MMHETHLSYLYILSLFCQIYMQAEVFVYHREALLRRMDHYGFFKGHFVNRQVFYIFNSKTFSEVRLPSLVSVFSRTRDIIHTFESSFLSF